MDEPLPERLRKYTGPITDSTRWSGLRHRPGDVVVCTPMKSGTTWSQAIVAMLIAGTDDVDIANGTPSPWVDHKLRPIEDVLSELDMQSGRRCMKTHTPLDGLPNWHDVSYIMVYRHPIDVHVSMRNFISNAVESPLKALFPEDQSAGFRHFLNGGLEGGDLDMPSLEAIVHHYEASRLAQRENVLILHYADMQRDPEDAVARIGMHIGTPRPPETIAAIVAATSFESMKSNAHRFTPYAGQGVWKNDAGFFDSGSGRKWEGRLTAEDLRAYDQRMEQLLSSEARHWLEHGDAPAPDR